MNKPISRKEKYGTTPGGISLDPRINPLHARMADLEKRINETAKRLEAAKAKRRYRPVA